MRRIIIAICVIYCIVLCGGCQIEKAQEKTLSTATTVPTQVSTPKILSVYQISRSLFQEFLENPDPTLVTEKGKLCEIGVVKEERYYTASYHFFTVTKELISFAGDTNALQQYIYEQGYSGTIQRTLFLDATDTPLVIWVQTDCGNIYITVCEEPEDQYYTYRIYSEQAFYERYICLEGTMRLDGIPVPSSQPVKIFHDNADIPFFAVLQALGATVTLQDDETTVSVDINGRHLMADVQETMLYEPENPSYNMLYAAQGGPIFIYPLENEVMVDYATLRVVLRDLGEPIELQLDRATATLIINRVS